MLLNRRLMPAIASVCLALPLAAEPDRSRALAEVQSKIHQVGGDVQVLAEERSKLLSQLQKLERQYGELANGVRSLKVEIKQQEQALEELRVKIAEVQRDMHGQQMELSGLVKAVYAMGGDRKGLKVILNQRDPALSSRMGIYYDYIGKARSQALLAMADDFKVLRQLEAQKDADSQLLLAALERKQQETDAMQALKKQRQELLARIEQDYASKSELLASLSADEKKLQALVASLQKTDDNEAQNAVEPPPQVSERRVRLGARSGASKSPETNQGQDQSEGLEFSALQGRLPWPVRGVVTERFGDRRYETTWDGVVISAREGAEIRAITAGRVVYADWLRGYGLMIIVDHGKGYMSLYAFNQSLHKGVGEHVRAGEILASVGRSGGRADAALYFGIRNKGRPVDPERWCRKSAKG